MKLYITAKEKNERIAFLNYLYTKGYLLDEKCNEKELLNSIFPITIIDKKINYLRSITVSACSANLHININEAKEIIENNKTK